jgi:hypothetical protein
MPGLADELELPEPEVPKGIQEEIGITTGRLSGFNKVFRACLKTDRSAAVPSNLWERANLKAETREYPFTLYGENGSSELAYVDGNHPDEPEVYLSINGIQEVEDVSRRNADAAIKMRETAGNHFPLLEKKEVDGMRSNFYRMNWENLGSLTISLFKKNVFRLSKKEERDLKFMIREDFEPEKLFLKKDGEIKYALLTELVSFIRRQLDLHYRREDEKRREIHKNILEDLNQNSESYTDFTNDTHPEHLDRYDKNDIHLLRKMEIAGALRTQDLLWTSNQSQEDALGKALRRLEDD